MTGKKLIAVQLGLIILVTAIAFYPSLNNGFTNWDDPELLLENESVKGLSESHLQSIFSRSYAGFGGYTPLVFLSYALEYEFFGMNPKVFHVDNLILHILNTILVYFFLFLVSRNVWISFVAALLFGVHPLHVEAVAWIQGRKDLLFSFFFLGSLISYLLFLKRKDKRTIFYALALLFFTCSLFSKVTAVALPLVILLLESHAFQSLDKGALRRSVPFFILAAVFLFLAFLTMRASPYGIPTAKVPLTYFQNLGLFFYAFVFYISKVLVPIRLIPRYPADIGLYPFDLLLNVVVFAVACVFFYLAYRRNKEFVRFGIAFFVLTLMPTLPFHFAGQPYADRYTYLPLAGLLLIISAFFLKTLPDNWPARRPIKYGVAVFIGLAVFFLGAKTWALSRVWHDSLSLWTRVLKFDPQNALAFANRGQAHLDAGELDKSLTDLNAAEALAPGSPMVSNNRGVIYFKRAEYDKALNEFDRCLAANPRFQLGHLNRGILWGRLGNFEKAAQDLTAAIEISKDSYRAYYYRGLAYKKLDRPDLALADFKSAFRISPTDAVRREIESLSGQKNP